MGPTNARRGQGRCQKGCQVAEMSFMRFRVGVFVGGPADQFAAASS